MHSTLAPGSESASVAVYYDGVRARARRVAVILESDALVLVEGNTAVARWSYADIRRKDAPDDTLCITSATAPSLARVDIADRKLAADIASRMGTLAASGGRSLRTTLTILLCSLAAAGSLIATAIYIVPLVADRLAPLVPIALERRIGEAVDNHVRVAIGEATCTTPEGSAALAKLVRKLSEKAALPMPVVVQVRRSSIPNALALPGGRIYLLSSLLERAQSPDEVAGVLAHEIGHVAHRDGMRVLIQNGGTSFLLGLLFGDVAGASAVIFMSRTLVDSAYSRDAERAADKFAADIMLGLGRSPRPLGLFLGRLMKEHGAESRQLAFLQSHPLSDERLAALSSAEPAGAGLPLLSEAEWQSLQNICKPQRSRGITDGQ